MRATALLMLITFLFSISGCASIINGTSDTINITSTAPNTELYVDSNPAGKGTAIVTVKRGKPHFILAKKTGCQDTTIQTGEKFDATSLLGILIDFGIISIPLDMLIGGAWKTEPKTYMVSPMCDVAAQSPGGTTFKETLPAPGKESTSSFTVERRLSETPIKRGDSFAVLPFVVLSSDAKFNQLSQGFSENLTYHLVRSQTVKVIERAQMDKALQEMKLGMTGIVDNSTAQAIGKVLGAKYVAIGAVEILGDHVEINCRILQVATSENVLVEKVSGKVNDLFELRDQVGQRISQQLVASVSSKKQ